MNLTRFSGFTEFMSGDFQIDFGCPIGCDYSLTIRKDFPPCLPR